jgi:hypothetical protein
MSATSPCVLPLSRGWCTDTFPRPERPGGALMAWLAAAMLFGGFRGSGGPIAKKDHRCAVFLA